MRVELLARAQQLIALTAHILRSFTAHHCLTNAAALSFTSLLAMVPLAAISLALLSAFPIFANVGDRITAFVLKNFTPDANAAIQTSFHNFVSNADNLTGFGILFMIFTSTMLLHEIEVTFNQIWQVQERRSLMSRLTIFWTAMTLGPVLIGLFLAMAAPIFASFMTGDSARMHSMDYVARLVPWLLEVISFSLLYMALPNAPVPFRHALIGGVVAGLLFEALKLAFGIFIRNFATYDAIYGALSALPVFLIWTYLSWAVILLGGVVTAEIAKLPATPETAPEKADAHS